MNCFLKISVLMLSLIVSAKVSARNDKAMFPISDALNTPAAKEKLNPDIKFYFGGQKHPQVATTMGERRTNKKTNGFNKTDKDACEWVFLSALLQLQQRVLQEGGNAVINIKSNYKNIETTSDTEYMCGNGTFTAGVAFKGDVVKLK